MESRRVESHVPTLFGGVYAPLVRRGEESVEPQTCQETARLGHPAGTW
jgi:hypothetical protein